MTFDCPMLNYVQQYTCSSCPPRFPQDEDAVMQLSGSSCSYKNQWGPFFPKAGTPAPLHAIGDDGAVPTEVSSATASEETEKQNQVGWARYIFYHWTEQTYI